MGGGSGGPGAGAAGMVVACDLAELELELCGSPQGTVLQAEGTTGAKAQSQAGA